LEKVQDAFKVLSHDLKLPSENLQESPDFMEFLQLLQCNFQVPPLPKEEEPEDMLAEDTTEKPSLKENHFVDLVEEEKAERVQEEQVPLLQNQTEAEIDVAREDKADTTKSFGIQEEVNPTSTIDHQSDTAAGTVSQEQNVDPDLQLPDPAKNPSLSVEAQDEGERQLSSTDSPKIIDPHPVSATFATAPTNVDELDNNQMSAETSNTFLENQKDEVEDETGILSNIPETVESGQFDDP
jgi:hypothetical protein